MSYREAAFHFDLLLKYCPINHCLTVSSMMQGDAAPLAVKTVTSSYRRKSAFYSVCLLWDNDINFRHLSCLICHVLLKGETLPGLMRLCQGQIQTTSWLSHCHISRVNTMPAPPTKEIYAPRVGNSDSEPVLSASYFDHFLRQTF